ncbi:hypothetical protein PAHAL_6G117400 [Panicum hallii]|uniref:Uncharacterized protein n=1 Tax=Panicum hallii TaxID=206008 RepID=A0A2T8IG56_9POAL|nr:hypothetical protein PAHAL_6G117400 [Panicum hallii]
MSSSIAPHSARYLAVDPLHSSVRSWLHFDFAVILLVDSWVSGGAISFHSRVSYL